MVKSISVLRIYFILLFGFIIHSAIAQNSITSDEFSSLSAFESFQERRYESVIGYLKSKKVISKDEEILLYLSELKTGEGSNKKVEKWIKKNPNHPIKPLVSYHLGEYYFYSQDSLKSRSYLSGLNVNDLSERDQASYGYIYGLHQLEQKRYKNAKNLFQHARKKGFPDSARIDYYEGYANYHLDLKDEAIESFRKVENSADFGTSSKFFIGKMRLDNGEFDEVIELAQNELSDERSITNSGFYQVIGEAYAQKGLTDKADAYFERAINLHPQRPSAALYYQAGVSKFRIGNEDLAIEYLTESGIQGGEYAQLSAFQLGRLYVKKEEFEKALTAYIESSTSEDEAIKEESYYQIANINAKLGNYADAISYSIDYLQLFKSHDRSEMIQNIIAQSYLKTSDYDLAIEHLNQTGLTNSTQKEVYQKVTYQKAILSFNDGNFVEAQKWFNESLKFNYDQDLKNNSYYHLGELALRRDSFDEAIQLYQNQSKSGPLTNYGIGYAFYNKVEYHKAIPYFERARSADDISIRNDSQVRLADCLFATKSYSSALATYQNVAQQVQSPYLTFQTGMSLKSLDRRSEAINSFESLFSDNRYAAASKFQAGMIRFEAAEFNEAEKYFSQVVENHPNSNNYLESLLNRGISRKNLQQLDKAQSDYEAILKDHIATDLAINAILGLQELQQAGKEVAELSDYINQYRKVNPEDGSLELIEFEAAKRLYFDFNYQEAAPAFGKYLSDYPESRNTPDAKYYQADSYYRLDDLANAKVVFDELKDARNSFTSRILLRLGDINNQLGNLEEAEASYRTLLELDLSAKDSYNARSGLMSIFYETERYNDAITISQEILEADWKPLNAESKAMLIQARSWFQLDSLGKAEYAYQQLADLNDSFGAEANYHLGLLNYMMDKYQESLGILFEMNSKYGSYSEWIDQSYLLIAKNYVRMDELFQAKATLRSIIQHAKNEEVKIESQDLLEKIEESVNQPQSDSTEIKN